MSKTYVLITPARNEEAHIEKTIESVIAQTVLPEKWVIVSDGSTDRTDQIVIRYASKHNFIEFFRREPDRNRDFGSKVLTIRAGLNQLKKLHYEFIGNLDADISFSADYYEQILSKFQKNQRLGLAGGILFESCGNRIVKVDMNEDWSVCGGVQMFRRTCYEEIGGYIPLPKGGVDTIAEIMARMHNWEVRSFPEIKAMHHRRTGTGKGHILRARFRQGIMHFSHGVHPLFETAKCVLRVRERPYLIGSILVISGYIWARLRGNSRQVPDDVVQFLRREQMARLARILA